MFDKQYRFSGTHAQMVSELTSMFNESAKAKLFERNLDVYINAPLIGYLYKRKGIKNTDSSIADQNIFPEQLINNTDILQYLFRVILLLDVEYANDKDTRLNKAFRNFGVDDADLALFDAYVLGGVEVLYEKLIEGTEPGEYLNRLYDFLEEFHERFNEEISNDDVLDLCRAGSNN